ncbi:uncharacterized protein B0I36DRAFT_404459 [Microdochium trichocladiopsis]|uniref:Uncharacterized protein n=1 Tax=Microdochium trichocladiopsis TaxID=1682393 RepID=A0A9P8XPC3_9PEZI|nr:uncharacterized protein B0I36DRAFT_404459 [Microdochium trichocladiopsis]KAH7007969.1 hypothetical protein B0I36DRAFT_404459 [Microdochium trichocladiopsis]
MANKTPSALVTGCSEGGIGIGLVHELRRQGIHVFATARSVDKMASLQDLSGITLLTMDVTNPASIRAAVAVVTAATDGALDYLVNNAGRQALRPFLDMSIDNDMRAMFDVNVFGVAAVTQAFAPLLIQSSKRGKGGMVVNLASVAAYVCPPYMGGYAASKAACEVMSETMRHELKPLGVKVLTVLTGAVKTKIFANAPTPPALPEDSLYLAASDEFQTRASGQEVHGRLGTVEAFARGLVGEMVRGREGRVKVGNMSAMIPFMAYHAPASLFDYFVEMNTGLDKVGK